MAGWEQARGTAGADAVPWSLPFVLETNGLCTKSEDFSGLFVQVGNKTLFGNKSALHRKLQWLGLQWLGL